MAKTSVTTSKRTIGPNSRCLKLLYRTYRSSRKEGYNLDRIVANLKRKLCPECKAVHYSALPEKTCLGCTEILLISAALRRRSRRKAG